MDWDIKVKAYSDPPPSRNTGDGKVNLVAIVPNGEVITCSGSITTSPNGTIFLVGNPVCMVLIWHVTGITSSFVWKNTSTEDTNIPFASVTSNDSASGSNHWTCSVDLVSNPVVCWKVFVVWLDMVVESSLDSLWISAVLILNTSSWSVFNVPLELNDDSATDALSTGDLESTALLDNLNVLVPVLNSGADGKEASGIKNDPINAPFSSLINLTSVTLASAPLVSPRRIIFFPTNPWNVPRTSCCNDPVSTFTIELVAE